MNVLITGATGFLGSTLCDILPQFDYQVYKLNRSNLCAAQDNLINIDELDEKFQNIDIIIHTATLYGRNNESEQDLYSVNVKFAKMILDKATKYKVPRFINIGTALSSEVNVYAKTKNEFSSYGLKQKTCFLDLQCQHFYGYKAPKSNFLRYIVEQCLYNNDIDLTLGTQKRDFISIERLVDIIIQLLKKEKLISQSIEIGVGIAPTIREVVEYIKVQLCSESQLNFGVLPFRENEIMEYKADTSVLQSLDIKYQESWKDGLQIWFKRKSGYENINYRWLWFFGK